MIHTTTTIRCDRCGKKVYTHQGDHEIVKETFRAFGWTFVGVNCYCAQCTEAIEEEENGQSD